MLKLIAKIFGTKSEKDIKRMMPLVEQTKREGEKLLSLSHDQLRAKTQEVRDTINTHLKPIDDQIQALRLQITSEENLDIHHKENLFAQIDKLELERNKELEKVLMQVLPVVFASVRDTARRLK